jgi:hypothetical protein
MRRKIIVIAGAALMLLASLVWAQTWHTANQATIAWDAVTTLSDTGDPIPAEDTVTYKVYIVTQADEGIEGAEILLGEIAETQYTVTLPDEGRYFVGVSCVRSHPIEGEDPVVTESAIAWSNDTVVTGDAPFGIEMWFKPSQPGGLHPVE